MTCMGYPHNGSLPPLVLYGKDGGHGEGHSLASSTYSYTGKCQSIREEPVKGRLPSCHIWLQPNLASTTLSSILIWANLFKVFELHFSFPPSVKVEMMMPTLKSS